MAGYKGGHILRIRIVNFMTYDELELLPKHGLNLIIGLNGSGKSSIMCAICLGLAGKAHFTGRSAQISDFIKYGCDKATIEIELEHLTKRNVVITRIIQSEKSTWMLNKTIVSLNEIQNAVKKFNIDISNLCQFLPQEKVTEFSKMDKKQRLENMLKAIGEPHLFNLFKELKELKLESLKVEESKSQHQSLKDVEAQKNQRLKVDVDKHEERLRDEEHLESLNRNKMIVEYNEIRQQVESLKHEKQPLKINLNNIQHSLNEVNKQLSFKSNCLNAANENLRLRSTALVTITEQISRKEVEMSELHAKIESVKIHFQNRLEERNNQISKMTEVETQLKALNDLHSRRQLELPALKERESIKSEELIEIKNEISQLTKKHTYTNLEKNQLDYGFSEIRREFEKMADEANKKMEFLKQRYKDVHDAVIWLKENKDKFKAHVHEPMFLSLRIEDAENRKFIENMVSPRDLVAFLCENKDDNVLLTNMLRIKKRLNVNIVMVPEISIQHFVSSNIDREMRNLGIQCFMKDVVEAPQAIMKFLCQVYKLHNIPICAPIAEQNMERILQKYNMYFTPDAKISGKYSKYGDRNFISRRDPIKSKNFLPSSKDDSEKKEQLSAKYDVINRKRQEIQSKLEKLTQQIGEKERVENKIREEKKQILDQIKEINNIEKQLEQKNQLYERKRLDLVDEEHEKFELKSKVQGLNKHKLTISKDFCGLLERFIQLKKEKLKLNLEARYFSKQLKEAKKIHLEMLKSLKECEDQIEEIVRQRTNLRERGLALHERIREFFPQDNEEQRKLFGNRGTLEEINAEIRSLQAKLDLNFEDNATVMEEFKERERRIAETQKEIDLKDKDLKKLKEEMMKKKAEWLPALEKHIRNINSKFSQYYKQLKCAGEISLDTCNNTDDFQKYGLQITLKYRDNEPFMELSNTHHSGGECSVAAIIFILSLQELTEVPFRCIDEINQGMDSQNERNIYNLIADSARNGSCSQYFLLTPKLLMDLNMIEHRDVAVHVIYNSCFLEMKMDVQKHIKLAGRN